MLFTKENALVHVSGHASAGELLHCYEVVKPKNVLPVHGEWRHMRANADLAMQSGLSEHNVVIAENGITIDVADGHADISGSVPCGYIYVDGQTVGEITESSLKDRRILGEEGFISARLQLIRKVERLLLAQIFTPVVLRKIKHYLMM